jgi:hypothetical protein
MDLIPFSKMKGKPRSGLFIMADCVGCLFKGLSVRVEMQEAFEKRFCDMHTDYMKHSTEDSDDVLEWIWSYLVLSGTAIYVLERPPDTPQTNNEMTLCQYLDNVTPLGEIKSPWNTQHAYEWLMQAGELRMWLQDGWKGEWNSLNIEGLTHDYIAILKTWK